MSALLESLQTYWPVHLLLFGYAGLLAYHAWVGNRETRGLADYYVGGRSMGGVVLGLSFFATYSSTNASWALPVSRMSGVSPGCYWRR